MTSVPLSDARAAVVHERVLAGVAEVLATGDDLTFAKVARAAGVPERTVYRHFPSREALLAAVFAWANRRIGFEGGDRPADGPAAVAAVRRTFPAFDELAPVIRELLLAPGGLLARLSDNRARQASARAVVDHEAPGLGEVEARRLAAAVQVLSSATTWQSLRDYWGMAGEEAAEVSALALDLLFEAARARSARPDPPSPTT